MLRTTDYAGERVRRDLETRARKSVQKGRVREDRFPVYPAGTEDLAFRQNGVFEDQTGQEIDGFMVTGSMMTGPGS